MSAPRDPSRRAPTAWSEEIRSALFAGVPGETIAAAFGTNAEEKAGLEAMRRELERESESDAELRAWLWSTWRDARRELVDGLARLLAGRGTEELGHLLRRFGAAELALAVISEPEETPAELAEEALAHLRDAGDRRELKNALDRLLARPSGAAPARGRLIVIGGHPRERARVDQLLGPLARDIKWIPAVKGSGRGEAQLSLSGVSNADAILIVTGRVSHSVMHGARKMAERLGVECCFVEQITELQVQRVLEALRARTGG